MPLGSENESRLFTAENAVVGAFLFVRVLPRETDHVNLAKLYLNIEAMKL